MGNMMRAVAVTVLLAVGCATNPDHCGGDSEPCCNATQQQALAAPDPRPLSRGLGVCGDGLACANVACPPRSTCDDGLYNGTAEITHVNTCVAVSGK